jgi:hypothetical protein
LTHLGRDHDFDQYRVVPDLLGKFVVLDSGAALEQMHKIIDAQRLSGRFATGAPNGTGAANECKP